MEQLAFVEVLPKMTYEQVEKQVVAMLKRYPKLTALIRSAERKAQGIGLVTSIRVPQAKIEHLATVGRAYTTDVKEHIHVQKAETLFHAIRGDDEEDEKALDEIRGLMIGTRPFGVEASVDVEGHVTTDEIAMRRWRVEAERLKSEKEAIEQALEELRSYAPHLEQLLRMRYIEKRSVFEVARKLGISERTHDYWKREAICEFAMLSGITEG
ncbi:hypothetical protein DNHGIG_14940 [Collibacillus ludicampi]|uniref:Sigma-70 family RNA polymerase sigma factor n=1 Tax=Collibacillus ludicampi TaxID=2771369 RepID=A0AAV4LDV6_9BACL|nr:DUF1492 domain-containing protein [Collibacillus ludicampi]GIM45945.1 hypothetical protein DNHGIG_14940 [Collibacillus ludicampi]